MKTDTWPIFLKDLAVSVCLLTRLPVPILDDAAFHRNAAATWAYPIVGLMVGSLAAASGFAALHVGLPETVAAGLLVAVAMITTGAMHEDGLADTVDGFWGGGSPERRLEIMKDSHIGTFGTLALLIMTGMRWITYTVLLTSSVAAIITVAILSRAVLPAIMHLLPNARSGGLSRNVGRPTLSTALLALAIGIGSSVILSGYAALPVLVAVLCAASAMAVVSKRKINGQTGDVLGATQQVSEGAGLIALLLLL